MFGLNGVMGEGFEVKGERSWVSGYGLRTVAPLESLETLRTFRPLKKIAS